MLNKSYSGSASALYTKAPTYIYIYIYIQVWPENEKLYKFLIFLADSVYLHHSFESFPTTRLKSKNKQTKQKTKKEQKNKKKRKNLDFSQEDT